MANIVYWEGQDVPLSAAVVDDTGTSAAPTVITVAVTDPTGAAVSAVSAPAHVGTAAGSYTAVVLAPTVPGTYLVRWQATGPGGWAWAYEDQFTVRPLLQRQLVDLAAVKKHMNMGTDSSQDDEIEEMVAAASEAIAELCVPLLPKQYTQTFDGGASNIVPDMRPIASVQSITEVNGVTVFTITEQPMGAQTNSFGFTVDYTTGVITRRVFGGAAADWAAGTKNITVVYTAGYAVVPYTVRLACKELVRHWWSTTQIGRGGRRGSSAPDSTEVMPAHAGVPYRIEEMLRPWARNPGIA